MKTKNYTNQKVSFIVPICSVSAFFPHEQKREAGGLFLKFSYSDSNCIQPHEADEYLT